MSKVKALDYFPVSELLQPNDSGLFHVYKDYFWIVTQEDCLIRFGGHSWQCNKDERIVKRFLNMYPGCKVVQYSWIFTPYEQD